jgi:hypothetical protein
MAAAAVRRGLPRQVSGSLVQQLRSLYTSSSTLLQQPIGAAAAAAAPEGALASAAGGGPLKKMNLYAAVNDALHTAMAADSKCAVRVGYH